MKKSALLLLFAVRAALALNAQTTLQLPLDPSRINAGLELRQTADGDFLMHSYFPLPNFGGGDFNLTRFRLQDGVLWSRDYFFSYSGIGQGTAAESPLDGALLMSVFLLDSLYNKVLVKLDPQGNVLWARRYGKPNDVSGVNIFTGKTLVVPLDDGQALLAGGASQIASNDGENDLFVAKINAAGDIVWARNLCFSCPGVFVDAALADLIRTSDGGALLAGTRERSDGTVTLTGEDALLVKLSAEGEVQWVRTYNSGGGSIPNDERAFAVQELPNGHFAVAGAVENVVSNLSDGLLLEVDAAGNLVRALRIGIAGSDHTVTLPKLIALDANTVTVSGSTVQDTLSSAAQELNFLAEIRLDGTVNWSRQYFPEPLVGYGTPANALQRLPGGGYAYLMNYALFFDNFYPILLLTDSAGRTGCELPVALATNTNLTVTASVVPLLTEPLTYSEDLPFIVGDFNGFEVALPVPDLGPDQTACAPFSLPLYADSTIAADSYRWSTGATTPAIVVNQAGEYALTVTVADFCLTAADTVQIRVSDDAPQAVITADTAGFCATGLVQLSAGLSQGAERLLWSTGDTTAAISVTAAGDYTLRVENSCGADTAQFALALPECDTLPPICPFIVPSAFTPNGDNTNDGFAPVGDCQEVERYVFRVFNRWGSLVFEANSPLERWNGQINDQPAASDVYIWYLQYEDAQRGAVREQGDVTLLR